jgi:hypothetical protein
MSKVIKFYDSVLEKEKRCLWTNKIGLQEVATRNAEFVGRRESQEDRRLHEAVRL